MTFADRVAIVGSGGHAASVIDACRSMNFDVVACIDSNASKENDFGVSVISDFSALDLSSIGLALGIGHNFARERAFLAIKNQYPEARFPVIVHSTAWVSPTAHLSDGTVVLSQASVGPFAKTGAGSLLNTSSSLDHESVLEDFASLGPGAHTGGQAVIGARSALGLNSGLLHGIKIGTDSVIGAGSLVRKNIPSHHVAFGIPCVPIRQRKFDEPYY